MASDNAQFKASVVVDFSSAKTAAQSAENLANALAELNSAAQKMGTSLKNTNGELSRGQTAIAKQATAFQTLAQAQQKSVTTQDRWANGKFMSQSDAMAVSLRKQADAANVADRALSANAVQLGKVGNGAASAQTAIQKQINAYTGVSKATTGITAANSAFNQSAKTTASVMGQAAKSTDQFGVGLASTQYALYNVASTLTSVGRGLLTFSTAPAAAAIAFQSDFAQVSRTVTGATGTMKQSLEELSTQIPVTFKDITEIASLGGQLGIASGDIVDFTGVVAKLTDTTNLSAEEAGTLLGRFQEMTGLPASKFANLASAVLKVGISSVATEKQIAQIASSLAGVARTSGYTAPQLIALAGALGSVGSGARQVQAASGSITRFVSNLETDIDKSNKGLDSFAKTAGVSAQTVRDSFGTGKFSGVFDKFIQGLHDIKTNGGSVNGVLRDIGLSGVQDQRVFSALAGASGLLTKLTAESAEAFRSAAILNEQYGKIASTTASKIQLLQNSFQVLLATLGQKEGGALGFVADALTNILRSATALSQNDVVQWITLVVGGMTALVGILSLVAAGAALGLAGILALVRSLQGLNATGALSNGILAALTDEMVAAGLVSQGTATKIGLVSKAVGGIGKAIGALTLGAAIFAVGSSISDSLDKATKSANGFKDTIQGTIDYVTTTKNTGLFANGKSVSALQQVNSQSSSARDANRSAANFSSLLATGSTVAVKDLDDKLAKLASGGSKNLGALSSAFSQLSKKTGISMKELTANDLPALRGAMDRTGISFKQTGDQVEAFSTKSSKVGKALTAIADSTGETYDAMSKLSDLTGMSADDITKFGAAYAKSVTPLTDFNAAVGEVQVKLSDLAAKKAASSSKSPQSFYDGISVSLAQLTTQYQTNNKAQEEWASNLETVAAKYGPAVANQFINAGYTAVNASILKQLTDAAPAQGQAYADASSRAADLAAQATANKILESPYLTYAGTGSADQAAKAFTAGLQAGIPVETLMKDLNFKFQANPVKPKADTKPAKKTVDSFYDAYNNKTIHFGTSANTGGAQSDVDYFFQYNNGRTLTWNAVVNTSVGPSAVPLWTQSDAYGTRASGGKIYGAGTETSDSIPTRLSKNEWVIKAASVRKYGDGFMDALNRGRVRTFAGGGTPRAVTPSSGGMGGIVELGPTSLRALSREVVNHIMLDDTAIYNASRRGATKAGNQGRF